MRRRRSRPRSLSSLVGIDRSFTDFLLSSDKQLRDFSIHNNILEPFVFSTFPKSHSNHANPNPTESHLPPRPITSPSQRSDIFSDSNHFKSTMFVIPSYFYLMMKSISITVLAVLVCLTVSIPFEQQIALLSSLEVGRLEDPMAWTCVGCE